MSFFLPFFLYEKSPLHETLNLSTDADSSIETYFPATATKGGCNHFIKITVRIMGQITIKIAVKITVKIKVKIMVKITIKITIKITVKITTFLAATFGVHF